MWQEDMVRALRAAKPRDRRGIWSHYGALSGLSRGSLYRIAAEYGWTSGRKKRADAGRRRSGLTTEQIEHVAALIHTTAREVKGPIMPVERALQIAVDNGYIAPGQVSVSRMQALLRERAVSKAALSVPSPHVEMRSLHPNHVHEADVSVCIQYYLKSGGLRIMDERDFYKNKPQNFAKIKTRLLRYVLTDHFSGAFFVYYFNTTGETANNLFDFLRRAWGRKESERYPFRGVPRILLVDPGAAHTAGAVTNLLEGLGVELPKGLPHTPRRQGCAEVLHNIWECWFESGLRIQAATDVDELNRLAQDFAVWFQGHKRHTRHGMTRSAAWSLIRADQLRELPADEVLHALYTKPAEDCLVYGNYTIRFGGKEYRVKHIEGVRPRTKIKVSVNPWMHPMVNVHMGDDVYQVAPIEKLPAELGGFSASASVIGQEYKAQPETATEQAKQRMENMAYGEERKKGQAPFAGLQVFGHHEEKLGNVAFIDRPGTEIQVDRSITKRRVPIIELIKRIAAEGRMTPELNHALRERYGETLTAEEADQAVRAVLDGGRTTVDAQQERRVG